MSDQLSSLPDQQMPSMRGPWIAWIIASTLMPALPFLLIGKKGLDDGVALIPLALMCQLGCSIWLARKMGEKLRKGPGFVVLMSFVFMIASVIIGTVSFFASCIGLGETPNFH